MISNWNIYCTSVVMILGYIYNFVCMCFRATTVRSKGRNLRIKAPMCRALKKLCDPDGVCERESKNTLKRLI